MTKDLQSGGTLRPGSVYLRRQADRDLVEALQRRELCYVLAPRQIGKSSLMRQAATALQAKGWTTVEVDLNVLGTEYERADDWYYGLTDEISTGLGLGAIDDYWDQHARLPPVQIFSRWLAQTAASLAKPIAIFLDEIDYTQSLPFNTDDFFAALRAVYNAGDAPKAQMALCMLGVATPSDLITDTQRTPFNIGTGIHLRDFTRDELQPLEARLTPATVDALYDWTSGHPYMTLTLAKAAEAEPKGSDLDALVDRTFLQQGRTEDTNLAYAELRLNKAPEEQRPSLFALYRQVLTQPSTPSQPGNPHEVELTLAGMVAGRDTDQNEVLQIRNRIFARVFDEAWLDDSEQDRALAQAVATWLAAGRDRDVLLRGQPLRDAQAWAAQRGDLTKDESAFLAESAVAEAEGAKTLADAEKLRAMEMRRQTTVRAVAAVVVALIVLSAATVWFSVRVAESAADLAQLKKKQQLASRARTIGGERLADAAAAQAQIPGLEVEMLLTAVLASSLELASQRVTSTQASSILRHRHQRPLKGHRDPVFHAAFSPDGRTLVTASGDGTARLWDIATGAPKATLKGHHGSVVHAAFSPDGTTLATASGDGTARLWNVATGDSKATLKGHRNKVRHAAFSPDGKTLVTASDEGTARLWNVATGALEATLGPRGEPVVHTAFSPDGTTLVTVSRDNTARLWNIATGDLQATLNDHRGSVVHAVFSPDGTTLVTASRDGNARLWNVTTGALEATLAGHDDGVRHAAFSPDGKTLVTAGDDGTARLWNVATGDQLATFEGHRGTVFHAAFSPDGTTLVTASRDGTARLWNIATSESQATLEGHRDLVFHASFSPDGKTLATASFDRTARLWNVATDTPQATLESHSDGVGHAAFSPDGTKLVTASWDDTTKTWNVPAPLPQTPEGRTYELCLRLNAYPPEYSDVSDFCNPILADGPPPGWSLP